MEQLFFNFFESPKEKITFLGEDLHKCTKCGYVGFFAHTWLYKNEREICNRCCETSIYDKKGLFKGCDCERKEEYKFGKEK